MAVVGIIANPASGKDIRRLVAYGSVFDNEQKVGIVRRVLLGLRAAEVDDVLYMPDYYGIVSRAWEGLSASDRGSLDIRCLSMSVTGGPADSLVAATLMAELGASCLVTVGGDGTNRMVAKGCGDVPLLAISTGTNNVFPLMMEGTVAGLVAGLVARGEVSGACVRRCKRIVVYRDGREVDMALVDAAVMEGIFVGARAIWELGSVRRVVLARAEPGAIGLSSLGARLEPVSPDDPCGLVIDVGPGGCAVRAPIAPGLIVDVPVRAWRKVGLGEVEPLALEGRGVVALDGEREVEAGRDRPWEVAVQPDGPRVVDVPAVLREACARRCFVRREG